MNRQIITNRIITALEKGVCPWKKTWASIAHKNQFSGKRYRGINQILLSLNPDSIPYWGTFLQWKELGCSVKKGEKASQVVFFSIIETGKEKIVDEETDKPETKVKKFPILRYYNIFHAGQIEDPQDKFKHLVNCEIKSADYDIANKIIETCGAEIRSGGDSAFYDNIDNYIRVPFASQFECEEGRLSAIFHELGHWADQNILGTKLSRNKLSPEYAYGELVAELVACFLCRACQISNDFENQENYIGFWVQRMKNDVGYIWRASRDASKITDHFLKQAGIVSEEENDCVENN
jgi:antirestriction protein ArdC